VEVYAPPLPGRQGLTQDPQPQSQHVAAPARMPPQAYPDLATPTSPKESQHVAAPARMPYPNLAKPTQQQRTAPRTSRADMPHTVPGWTPRSIPGSGKSRSVAAQARMPSKAYPDQAKTACQQRAAPGTSRAVMPHTVPGWRPKPLLVAGARARKPSVSGIPGLTLVTQGFEDPSESTDARGVRAPAPGTTRNPSGLGT
jgi:hypothetical protein